MRPRGLVLLLVALLSVCPIARAQSKPQNGEAAPGSAASEADASVRFTKAADYSAQYSGRALLIQRAGHVLFERYDNGWAAERPW